MRVVAVLVLLVGCRVNFDRAEVGDDVAPDDAARDSEYLVDAIFDDGAPASCPDGYMSVGVPGSKYKAVDDSLSWTQAQAACVADGQHLAIYDDALERSIVPFLLPLDDQWLGVTDRITLGTWRTVTGAPATYLPWSSGEPDVSSLERCVEAESPAFEIIDQDCASGRRYICECDGRATDPASY